LKAAAFGLAVRRKAKARTQVLAFLLSGGLAVWRALEINDTRGGFRITEDRATTLGLRSGRIELGRPWYRPTAVTSAFLPP
jgi:hypothetical protein